MVFPSRRIAVFIHGCFWHGHDCPHGKRKPATNLDYWNEKIKRNIERDIRVQKELIELGWKPVIIRRTAHLRKALSFFRRRVQKVAFLELSWRIIQD
jgi:DNA mismatch endonuclease Vsr